eukprot:365329-Chlamydomonas_euryale.AAC.9
MRHLSDVRRCRCCGCLGKGAAQGAVRRRRRIGGGGVPARRGREGFSGGWGLPTWRRGVSVCVCVGRGVASKPAKAGSLVCASGDAEDGGLRCENRRAAGLRGGTGQAQQERGSASWTLWRTVGCCCKARDERGARSESRIGERRGESGKGGVSVSVREWAILPGAHPPRCQAPGCLLLVLQATEDQETSRALSRSCGKPGRRVYERRCCQPAKAS